MPTREQLLTAVEQFFDGPRSLDRLSLMSDDVEWWNGLGKFPAAPGQTVFRGKDEIGRIVLGRAPSPTQPNGRAVDRYDDAGLIDRIWEHWGTLQAYETLFQGPLVVHDPDLVLQTTPSVRKRLDLQRPVEREVLEACLDLGSAWTTLTLIREREVADLLGIPHDQWMQVGLFPVAYTVGTDFRVTPRKPAAELIRWNGYARS